MNESCARRVFSAGRLLLAFFSAACASPSEKPSSLSAGSVPVGSFAVVGAQGLGLKLLAQPEVDGRGKQARLIVRDELFGQEARSRALYQALSAERGVLARGLLEQLKAQALAERAITAQELAEERARGWLRFDRPRAVRSVQIYLEVPPLSDDRPLYELALRIREAAKDVHHLEEFGKVATEVAGAIQLQAYPLPPLASDGRIVPMLLEDENYQTPPLELARAAAALESAGDVSGVVATESGFHVLFATEIIEESRPPEDEIHDELVSGAVAARIELALAEIKRKAATPVVRRRTDVAKLLQLVEHSR